MKTKTLFTLHRYLINYIDDWDTCLLCWNEETQQTESIMVDSTRGGITVQETLIQASPEQQEKAANSLAQKYKDMLIEAHIQDVNTGDQVTFIKSYKSKKGVAVSAGANGKCFWKGENKFVPQFKNRPTTYSYGIELTDGTKVFVGIEKLNRILDADRIDEVVKSAIEDKSIFKKVVRD